jgi:hypothetical protein
MCCHKSSQLSYLNLLPSSTACPPMRPFSPSPSLLFFLFRARDSIYVPYSVALQASRPTSKCRPWRSGPDLLVPPEPHVQHACPCSLLHPPPLLPFRNHNDRCPRNRQRRNPQITSATSAAWTTSLPKPAPARRQSRSSCSPIAAFRLRP